SPLTFSVLRFISSFCIVICCLFFIVVFLYLLFFLNIHPQPISPLFPYTTLFRSQKALGNGLPDPARSAGYKGYLSGKRLFRKVRSEEHTSELQSRENLVCRLLLEKKKLYLDNDI